MEVYDSDIYIKYSKEEIEKVNGFIDHDRDFLVHLRWIASSS